MNPAFLKALAGSQSLRTVVSEKRTDTAWPRFGSVMVWDGQVRAVPGSGSDGSSGFLCSVQFNGNGGSGFGSSNCNPPPPPTEPRNGKSGKYHFLRPKMDFWGTPSDKFK